MKSGKGLDAVPSVLRRTAAVSVCFLVIAAAVGLFVYLLVQLAPLTMAIIVAMLLAALLSPVVRWTRRLRAPGWAAALAGLLTLLIAIAGPIALVTGQAAGQWEKMRKGLVTGLQRARDQLVNGPLPISERQLNSVVDSITTAAQQVLPDPVAGASMAAEVLAAMLIALFVLFFVLKDGRQMWGWIVALVPEHHRARIDDAGRAGWRALVSYVHGIVVIALVDALGIGLALVLLGVPFALPLTLLTFVAAFIPFIGAVFAGSAAVLIAFVAGGVTDALLVLAAVLIVQQAESHLLQPLIMGRTLHLHPVVIIISVTAGTLLAGVAGAVIAVPLVAVAYRVVAVLGADDPAPAEP